MKKILLFFISVVMLFSVVSCQNDDSKKDRFANTDAEAVHTIYFPDMNSFEIMTFSVSIDGNEAEAVYTANQPSTDNTHTTTSGRFVGKISHEGEYIILSVEKAYRSMKITGEGAEELIKNQKSQYESLLNSSNANEDERKTVQMFLDMLNGKEVDATEMTLSVGTSVVIRIGYNEEKKQILSFADIVDNKENIVYSFTYFSDGKLATSTSTGSLGRYQGTAAYRKNGSIESFTANDSTVYRFDEGGNLIK